VATRYGETLKTGPESLTTWGGWRRNGWKIDNVKQRDLGRQAGEGEGPTPRFQESERPYEQRRGVTPAEQRDAGRWMWNERIEGIQPGGSADRG
jgi:hypothetical protein